jgi:uncharacterized membrane protein
MERAAVVISFLLSIVAGALIYFMDVSTEGGMIKYTNVYMALSAFSWLFIIAALRFASRDKPTQYIAEFGLILAFSQVLDELFFTPNVIQVNEVILFIGAVFWLLYRFQYIKIGRNG